MIKGENGRAIWDWHVRQPGDLGSWGLSQSEEGSFVPFDATHGDLRSHALDAVRPCWPAGFSGAGECLVLANLARRGRVYG